jgi:hypothetical protein
MTLLTIGIDIWKRTPCGMMPFSRKFRKTKYDEAASLAYPSREPGCPNRTRSTPGRTLKFQASSRERGNSCSTPSTDFGLRMVSRSMWPLKI